MLSSVRAARPSVARWSGLCVALCAAQVVGSRAPAAAEPPSRSLVPIPQRLFEPDFVHPTLPRAGRILVGTFCDVWDLPSGTYAGQVPASRCQGWLRLGARSAFSPDRSLVAQIRPGAGAISVVRADTGAVRATFPIGADQEVLQVGWGPLGLAVTTSQRLSAPSPCGSPQNTKSSKATQPPCREERLEGPVHLLHFGSLEQPAKRYSFDIDSQGGAHLLDPLARYCFLKPHKEDPRWHSVFDIVRGSELRIPELPQGERGDSGSDGWRYGWSAESPPSWQSKSTDYDNSCYEYKYFRIVTDPGNRALLERSGLSCPDGKESVFAEGKAVPPWPEVHGSRGQRDPSGRFLGINHHQIERLSDHEQIIFDCRHCAHTKSHLFNCMSEPFSSQIFRLGSDPVTAPIVRGGQLANLFYRPNLIDDFFDGRPLRPVQSDQAVGLPPGLVLLRSKGQDADVVFEFQTLDTRDGFGDLRTWFAGKPLRTQPIPSDGRIDISVMRKDCPTVEAYACNRHGSVCSPPQLLTPCTRMK